MGRDPELSNCSDVCLRKIPRPAVGFSRLRLRAELCADEPAEGILTQRDSSHRKQRGGFCEGAEFLLHLLLCDSSSSSSQRTRRNVASVAGACVSSCW